jgi:hypothetical protein
VVREIPPGYILGLVGFCFLMLFLRTHRNYSRMKAAGMPLRPVAPTDAIFSEAGASGYSERSLKTRVGGATRILLVWVSPTELAIQKMFPFSVLLADYDNDLEHKISLKSITGVDIVERSKARVCFNDSEGGQHALMLQLKDPARFVSAIGPRGARL